MGSENDPIERLELSQALRKRRRWGETLIQSFLFLCGMLSILVTAGIVYELGKESLLFFTRVQWEETNKTLASALVEGSLSTVELSQGEGLWKPVR